jgi:exonuclease VII small subunit
MSDTPRTNFIAHETGDAEWDRSINRFGRMMAHACILERELAAAQAEITALRKEKNT